MRRHRAAGRHRHLVRIRGVQPCGIADDKGTAAVKKIAVPERHATAVVTSINFDYRAFDTLGEEFILFAAVLASQSLAL